MIRFLLSNRARHWTWLVLGAVAGTLLANVLAVSLQTRAARAQLVRYQGDLLDLADQMATEVNTTAARVSQNSLPLCSPEDLAFMRREVYNAHFVREIGRRTNGLVRCTAGSGLETGAVVSDVPDAIARGAQVTTSVKHLFGTDSPGFLVERSGVAMAINPALFLDLDRPPLEYGAWLHVPENHVLRHSFGHDFLLPSEQVTSGRQFSQGGMLYSSACSRHAMACIVVRGPAASFTAFTVVRLVSVVAGALLGATLAALAILGIAVRRSPERQLRRAIENGELRLEYQPMVDLATRSVAGVEALARWMLPNGKPVSPDVFIRMAEDRGFIRDLTRYIVRLSLRELDGLLGSAIPRVTINISAQDLSDQDFPDFLDRALSHAGVAAANVGLEITEHSTADQAAAISAIETLRAQGHSVSIDDFGTGYSSLAYLHQLSVDCIKVDRSFTQTVGTEVVTASVVPQILMMAAQLRLTVVVEGIETEQQAAYFAAFAPGALGQGYLFGKPMPAATLREWLASHAMGARR